MPFSSTSRIRLWVSSSTVSLKASLGVWPFLRSTSYWASMSPASAPISTPRSPVRSLVTSCSKVVGKRYPDPIAIPTARQRSRARPVASCSTAKLELIPTPARKLRRTFSPDPFGATMITSTSSGGITLVLSRYTMEKPWEKYRASPGFRFFFTAGHTFICAASETSNWTMVARWTASSMSNRVSPGFQPSLRARSQSFLNCLAWPTMTLIPLSFIFRACAGPWTPYPITATVSFFRTRRACASVKSFRVITSSSTPPKFILAMKTSPVVRLTAHNGRRGWKGPSKGLHPLPRQGKVRSANRF